MADAIVQTIKIEVDGAEEASAEIRKVGQATEDVQKTAASTAGGTKELGKGLDEVSQKAGVSGRQLKSLGKIAHVAGIEGAGAAVGFMRIAGALGPVGIALFAAAEAFSFIKGKMKEAEEAAKAITTTFANVAKISAEMKAEGDASFWGTTADGMKKAANDASRVADQLRNIARGVKEVIDPLTTTETETKAFIIALERAGISINDVMADTKKLGQASQQAAMEAAKIYEKMSPIEKLNFEKVLKGLGFTDAQIKNIEKGSVALKKLQTPLFTPEQQQSIDNLSKGWDGFVAASQRAWAMVMGDAESGTRGWAQSIAAGFANGMAVVGQFERDVVQAVSRIPGQIGSAFSTLSELIGVGIDAAKQLVADWVATPLENAWQWVADTFNGAVASVKAAIDQATAALTAWVTTPIANAWQWIVDAWNAMLSKLGIGGGSSGGSPAGATTQGAFAGGGLLGGRGSGTSDSNLAWVSRGEYIVPARVVQQPGMLAILEALRLHRFARGGSVGPGGIQAYADGGQVGSGKVVSVISGVRQVIDGMAQAIASTNDAVFDLVRGVQGTLEKGLENFSKSIQSILQSTKKASDTLWDFEQAISGHASGGLLGGRGTGTSDSNLAWVSRGEHIMPARAVAQPGVLAFLESLRRSGGNLRNVMDGMGRFALGGMVRGPLGIPAFAGGGMNAVTINFPGLPEITGLRASSGVVDELRKAAAMAQVRSGGRKPSRYS